MSGKINCALCCVFTLFIGSSALMGAEDSGENTKKMAIVISSLPDNIKLITGEGKEVFYAPRIREVHRLSIALPQDQIDACYEFLHKKIETQTLPDLQFNGIKNELVFALIRQERKPAELAGHLVKIYRDKSFDETWRDYCVQFFGKWYPNAPENQGRRDMADGLWHALKNERRNRIAGAAASQLVFLSRQYPEQFDQAKVSAACFEALNDPECANISKVALIQACAGLGNKEILPTVRQMVANERDILTRVSAIGALGLVGDRNDIPQLKELEKSRDIRLQKPAKAAIERIEGRIAS